MLLSKEYVSGLALGDYDACRLIMLQLDAQLKPLTDQKLVKGTRIAVLADRAQIEERRLDAEVILRRTRGELPAVWLNVTYDTEIFDPARLQSIEAEFELEVTGGVGESFYR